MAATSKKYLFAITLFLGGAFPFFSAHAAITLTQSLGATGHGVLITTTATTTTAGTVAVVCAVSSLSGSFASPPVFDSYGNFWTQLGSEEDTGASAGIRLAYAVLTSAGAGETFSVSNGITANLSISVGIFSGVNTSSAFDAFAGNIGSSTAPSTGSNTPTSANDLFVGCKTHDKSATTSVGSGFTQVYNNDTLLNAQPLNEEYQILSGTPSTAATWSLTNSGSWAALGETFLDASGGGGGGGSGGLSCTVSTSCPSGVIVFNLAKTAGSHAELSSQSNYTNFVCCSGVTGLGNSCAGTSATVLNLQQSTNSHVEEGTLSNYSNKVCLSVPAGSISVGYQNNNCTGFDTTVGSISATTNAHVGDGNAYTLKICASGQSGTKVLTQEHYQWFANADSLTPGSSLASGDTGISNVLFGNPIRLRMNIGDTGANVNASSQAFKIQYATSTAGPWTDVGASGGTGDWTFYINPTPVGGSTIPGTLVTSSTVSETYGESNPTPVNPNAIAVGNWGEYDWALDLNVSNGHGTYYFRMVKSDGTALDNYTRYPSAQPIPTYLPSGSLISDIIDTSVTNGVAPNSLYFEGSEPASTTVKFQFAGSNSTAGPWTYTGWNTSTLSCDTSSFYTPTGPNAQTEIKANCYNNKRYIRYEVYLATSISAITPRVDRIILNYGQ